MDGLKIRKVMSQNHRREPVVRGLPESSFCFEGLLVWKLSVCPLSSVERKASPRAAWSRPGGTLRRRGLGRKAPWEPGPFSEVRRCFLNTLNYETYQTKSASPPQTRRGLRGGVEDKISTPPPPRPTRVEAGNLPSSEGRRKS